MTSVKIAFYPLGNLVRCICATYCIYFLASKGNTNIYMCVESII